MDEYDYGDLMTADSADYLRPATMEERDASREAARHDGGAGFITVDEVKVYVQE